MKRFILEQSDDEFYTNHSGLALAGLCINRYSDLARITGGKLDNSGNLISNTDILRSYLGLLCLGKSDYEAITSMHQGSELGGGIGLRGSINGYILSASTTYSCGVPGSTALNG